MKINFDIQVDNSVITIEDTTTSYIPEDSDITTRTPNTFKKSEVLPIIILEKDDEIKATSFSNIISVTEDGKYTLYYILLPTSEYINTLTDVQKNIYTNGLYYTDGKYIYNKNGSKKDIGVLLQNDAKTTISRASKELISINNLQECYLNLCKQIFNDRMFTSCFKKSNIDSELIYKRDIVWMTINVIKYLVEKDNLDEAYRYIQIIQGCNGICSNNSSNKNEGGCGCSKR